MADVLRIGNAQGFWGDSEDAPARLVAQQPDLDYLTLDYLAEVSMSILAAQREHAAGEAETGFPLDFLRVVESLMPFWEQGARVRLIANAGGLNPQGCGRAVVQVLQRAGCRGMRIAVVSGDDVLPLLRGSGAGDEEVLLRHLETNEPLAEVRDQLVTANAYLGAQPVVEALATGAQIIITGRVADPSLTVAPCVHHFGWSWDEYDRLAGATVAGHLIECGTQVTGGISTDWLDVPDPAHIGFPVAEVAGDGACVITKPAGTGGRVSEQTVKEQLLYEIGDPEHYLSPDATVSFLGLRVTDHGRDRVEVRGAIGSPPPPHYKVSATYRAGFRAQGTLTIAGRDAQAKAEQCTQIVLQRLREAAMAPAQWHAEYLGAGGVAPGVLHASGGNGAGEIVLRLAAADPRREVVERFTRELSPLITAGPQGITGYSEGRPRVHPVFGYWPCLLRRQRVTPRVEVLEA